jgi:hypothetical protein
MRPGDSVRRQQRNLAVVMHHGVKRQPVDQFEVARRKETFQQEDRFAPPGRAGALSLRKVKQRECHRRSSNAGSTRSMP